MPDPIQLFSSDKLKIVLKTGSILNTDADTIVIPKSTNCTFSSGFQSVLELLGISQFGAKETILGDIEYWNIDPDAIPKIPQNKTIREKLRAIIYATSVENERSTYLSIRNIGRKLAEYANNQSVNNPYGKSIAIPILGTGAGKLDKSEAYLILIAAFREASSLQGNCILQVYEPDEAAFNALAGLSFPSLDSQRLTFMATVQQNRDISWVREVTESKEFYFDKATQAFTEFSNFTPTGFIEYDFYTSILEAAKKDDQKKKKFSFQEFLSSYNTSSTEYAFLLLLGKLVAYLDSKAYNKAQWNEYPDKRTLANSTIRQDIWLRNLIWFKRKTGSERLIPSIRNAIRYLEDPEHEWTMLSENHRSLVLGVLFNTSYTDSSSLRIASDFFQIYISPVNPQNRGYLYTRLLYLNDIRALWENKELPPDEEPDKNIPSSEQSRPDPASRVPGEIKACIHSDIFAKEDLLNYNVYAHAIVQFLKHPDTRPPLTIGILAPWGKGKTTMMRLIQGKLDAYSPKEKEIPVKMSAGAVEIKEDAVNKTKTLYKNLQDWVNDKLNLQVLRLRNPTVWFNAWKFQKSEQVWAGFAHEIINQLVNKLPNDIEKEKFWFSLNLKRIDKRKIKNQLTFSLLSKLLRSTWYFPILLLLAIVGSVKYFPQLYIAGPVLGVSVTGWAAFIGVYYRKFQNQKVDFDLSKYVKQPDYDVQRGYFHQVESDLKDVLELLVSKEDPVVIFIDDLDRCSPKMVVEVVEAINLFISGDFPDCYFVLGQDAQMVAASLDAAYKDVEVNVSNIENTHGSLGWYFMEKFIQLQFNIPNITKGQSEGFLKALLNQQEDDLVIPDAESKAAANKKIDELSQSIGSAGNSENFISFASEVHDLEGSTVSFVPEKIAMLKEQIINNAAKNFKDNDAEVGELISSYARYLGNSPRLIKRFVNLYRFYRFLQFSGQNKNMLELDSNVMGRWIILMIRWPQLIRCIQWDTEKDFYNGFGSFEKAEKFEKDLLDTKDYAEWKEYASVNFQETITWVKDKSLYDFIHETSIEGGTLEEGVRIGIW